MSFPRHYARTHRFTLGLPRDVSVAPSGDRVLFLRSGGPTDPVTDLWEWTLDGERRLLSARDHLGAVGEGLPASERARRERLRETASGVTGYATDRDVQIVATSLDGELVTVDVVSGEAMLERSGGGIFDPRPDPDGGRIAFVRGSGLYVIARGGDPAVVVEEPGVTWGLADFVAAEEMHRVRGYWWSPDGTRLAACRVDERAVGTWFIADPANPDREPAEHRYPAAGTVNPEVSLSILTVDGAARVDVEWDADRFPYLARVSWGSGAPLTLLVQSRTQQCWQVLTVDATSGATTVVQEDHDPAWLELVDGVPAWTGDGRLVTVRDLPRRGEGGTRCVLVDGEPVTPPGLQVESVVAVEDSDIWFTAFPDPFDLGVYRLDVSADELVPVVADEGWHGAAARGGTAVITTSTVSSHPTFAVLREGREIGRLATDVEEPSVTPTPRFLRLGPRGLPAALLMPTGQDGGGALPVLLSPYGGPGLARARRARRSREGLLEAQWFADQGFAVLAVDNRGMPGVDVAFEKAVAGDLATPVLDDQVAALLAASELEPRIDLDRVAIRGWSFGGFLAALALLRRPDVFHVGIAGAPVTDWHLYDTHYTERYLGLPDERPDAYRISSLVGVDGGLVDAVPWEDARGRLMIIHGLADDNVVAAHSLRLSSALLADGRPHQLLPLSGVTHMTPQEVVAENLLHLQLDFLRRAVG